MEKLQPTMEAALDEIMREYGTRVLRLVTFLVKDRSLAEDITQDVFVKVYRNMSRFRKQSSMHTWIYRIAVNECKAHLRSWALARWRLFWVYPRARCEPVCIGPDRR